jgi:hypothetical protein
MRKKLSKVKKVKKKKKKRMIARQFGRKKIMSTDLDMRGILLVKREQIKEFSIIRMVTFIWANGEMTNLMVRAHIFSETVSTMKVLLKMV